MRKLAILIDGGFVCRHFKNRKTAKDAEDAASILSRIVRYHVRRFRQECKDERAVLYRSFYYDAEPFDKTFFNPITKQPQHYKETDTYIFKSAFLPLLTKQRKMAMRLGRLDFNGNEIILSASIAKDLAKDPTKHITDYKPSDVKASIVQKQVDMKIGLDLASLAYKRLVDQVVLISADSDFVPVLKVARREGIDVVLDSMGATIKPELNEHIDGVRNSKKDVIEKDK